MSNRQAVDDLLAMYEQYKQAHRTEAELVTKLAKAKVLQADTAELAHDYLAAKQTVQTISDAMTFANPIIWMLYKYEAYANEPQPIRTVQDFRIHCSKPDYICTKRYTFLNDALIKNGSAPLDDRGVYPDSMLLEDIARSESITALVDDSAFQKQWDTYEYHQQEGAVKKWENFKQLT